MFCRAFKGSLNSPSRVLQEQIGNSFEMSILLVSLLRSAMSSWSSLLFQPPSIASLFYLRGFGFSAYVAVGWVDEKTARLDQTNMLCPLLAEKRYSTLMTIMTMTLIMVKTVLMMMTLMMIKMILFGSMRKQRDSTKQTCSVHFQQRKGV